MSAITDLLQRLPRWFTPALAALGGLIFGLLVGWVWWPVQWTNATLAELSPTAQATYLSAVADAYVSDGDPNNAVLALNERLAPFGSDVEQSLLDAITWHQMQAVPDNARINNLAVLAAELGAPVDASTLATGAAPPLGPDLAPAGAELAADTAAAETAATETGGGAWRWILGLIGTAILVGGGIWLFRRVWQQQESGSHYVPVPLPASSAPPSSSSPSPAPARPAPQGPTSAWSTTVVKPAGGSAVAPGDDLSFDTDDLDDNFGDDEEDEADDDPQSFGPSDAIETEEDLRNSPPAARYGAAQSVPAGQAVPRSSPWAQPPGTPQSSAAAGPSKVPPSAVLSVATAAPQPVKQGMLSRLATAVTTRTVQPVTRPESSPAVALPKPIPAKPVPIAAPPAAVKAPGAQNRLPLATHTFEYTAGVQGYIDAANITDPQTHEHIGEYGLGVSSRNAALHHNPNQVIALELWLVDNNQVNEEYSGHARLLLSDYAAGKDYAQALLKDRDPGVRTMMTRSGSRFTLEGRHLLLDAVIENVDFDDQGIFRNVRISTTVYRK